MAVLNERGPCFGGYFYLNKYHSIGKSVFLPSWSRVGTDVRQHHLESNETFVEKA